MDWKSYATLKNLLYKTHKDFYYLMTVLKEKKNNEERDKERKIRWPWFIEKVNIAIFLKLTETMANYNKKYIFCVW